MCGLAQTLETAFDGIAHQPVAGELVPIQASDIARDSLGVLDDVGQTTGWLVSRRQGGDPG